MVLADAHGVGTMDPERAHNQVYQTVKAGTRPGRQGPQVVRPLSPGTRLVGLTPVVIQGPPGHDDDLSRSAERAGGVWSGVWSDSY